VIGHHIFEVKDNGDGKVDIEDAKTALKKQSKLLHLLQMNPQNLEKMQFNLNW
jgi:hypothetical protein